MPGIWQVMGKLVGVVTLLIEGGVDRKPASSLCRVIAESLIGWV